MSSSRICRSEIRPSNKWAPWRNSTPNNVSLDDYNLLFRVGTGRPLRCRGATDYGSLTGCIRSNSRATLKLWSKASCFDSRWNALGKYPGGKTQSFSQIRAHWRPIQMWGRAALRSHRPGACVPSSHGRMADAGCVCLAETVDWTPRASAHNSPAQIGR